MLYILLKIINFLFFGAILWLSLILRTGLEISLARERKVDFNITYLVIPTHFASVVFLIMQIMGAFLFYIGSSILFGEKDPIGWNEIPRTIYSIINCFTAIFVSFSIMLKTSKPLIQFIYMIKANDLYIFKQVPDDFESKYMTLSRRCYLTGKFINTFSNVALIFLIILQLLRILFILSGI